MRKLILFLAGIFISAIFVNAQQIYLADNGLIASGSGTSKKVSLGGTALNNAQTVIDFGTSNTLSNFLFKKGASNYLFISNAGLVGINNVSPTEKLDVTGNIRFSGGLMPNNTPGVSGQVLTSAGAGVAPTWTNANAAVNISNTDLTATGNRICNFTGNRLWFKTGTNTGMTGTPANTFWFGLYNTHPATVSGTIPAHQDNAIVNITTDKTWGNENGQALAISVGNANDRNGFVFYNYSNVQGNIIPSLTTYSNSTQANGDPAYSHWAFAKNVTSTYPMIEWITGDYSFAAVTARPLWTVRNGTQTKIRLDNSGTLNIFPTGTSGYTATTGIQLNPNGDSYFKTGGISFQGALLPNNVAGSTGQVLVSQGTGTPPIWATPTSSLADGSETKLTAGTNVSITGLGTNASPYVINAAGSGGSTQWTTSGIGSGNIINSNAGAVIIGTGITTLPSTYKLYVSDGILAEKVKVALKSGTNWADYVFDKNYKLTPLAELETFINKNKHLPNIPSAQELVNDGGIDVNQMFSKQMEKIEELSLYIIEMNKKLEKLEQENAAMKASITNK